MLFIEETSPPPFYQEQLTADERLRLDKWFIGKRSQTYYLKRFAEFDKQGYLSAKWHWASFFATFGWLLYRKRYLDSIVYTVAGWSFIQLNVVIILVAFEFAFMPLIPDAYQMMTRLSIAGLIWIFWAVIVASWTDAYYYRMARREIADAIADHPNNLARQKAHLKREGGVSQVGLGIALGLFIFMLTVIQVQFLPIYAVPRERGIIQTTYEAAQSVRYEVEAMYQKTGQCPTNQVQLTNTENPALSLDTVSLDTVSLDIVSLDVVSQSESLPNTKSPCLIIATMQNVPFPNRNLNGQKIIFYRDSTALEAKWRCTTSLNEKKKPILCSTTID